MKGLTIMVQQLIRAGRPGRPLPLALTLALLAALLGAAGASAHVTVSPREATAGASQTYTVRVPTEKSSPTVRVRVEFPPEVTVTRFQPKPGWRREVEKDGSGKIVAVTWSGGQIAPDEWDEFAFSARNPSTPGTIAWRAYQTYADGETVEWTGPEGSERPAAVTTIRPAPASTPTGDDHGAAGAAQPGATPAAAPTAPAGPSGATAERPAAGRTDVAAGSDLPLLLGLAALVVALVAAVLSGLALARRPRAAA